MPEEFITIKEAALQTGKAEITIRRFVQRIVKGTDAKRAMLQPSPDELQQHVDGPPPAWRISTKLLSEQFPSPEQGSESAAAGYVPSDEAPIVAVLKAQNATMEKQLEVKDEQIKSLTTLVHSLGDQLNDRLQESNVLMKGLQERMALPERTKPPIITVLPTEIPVQPARSKRTAKKEVSKPSRSGWVRRLFAGKKSTT